MAPQPVFHFEIHSRFKCPRINSKGPLDIVRVHAGGPSFPQLLLH
jgi:hypothetical protein